MIRVLKASYTSLIFFLVGSVPALASGADLKTAAELAPWKELQVAEAGSTVFRWWGFRVYEARLFLPSGSKSEGFNAITVRPKVLSLTYNTSFTAEEFFVSSKEILAANNRVDPSIAKNCLVELKPLFQPVAEGDSYHLIHRQDGKLDLRLNDQLLGTVCDENGTRAYFSIWLSREHSIKESFQRDLLGATAITSEFMAEEQK